MAQGRSGRRAPAWIVTFADLVTLLLAFFVLMLSFSSMDLKRYRSVSDSMNQAFNDASGGALDQSKQGQGEKSAAESEKQGTFSQLAQQIGESKRQEIQKQLEETFSTLKAVLKDEVKEGKVHIELGGNATIIRFDDSAYFTSGSEAVSPEIKEVVIKIGPALAEAEGTIIVQGHTDDVPISSERFRSNWDLSTARAASVVHQLLQNTSINPGRFVVQGHADSKPLAPNDSDTSRSRNRRVEIHVVGGG